MIKQSPAIGNLSKDGSWQLRLIEQSKTFPAGLSAIPCYESYAAPPPNNLHLQRSLIKGLLVSVRWYLGCLWSFLKDQRGVSRWFRSTIKLLRPPATKTIKCQALAHWRQSLEQSCQINCNAENPSMAYGRSRSSHTKASRLNSPLSV